MFSNKKESSSLGKILVITGAVVAGACTVIWFAMKLYRKYCLLEHSEGDDLEELTEDGGEDHTCEIVFEDDEDCKDEASEEDPAGDKKEEADEAEA